MADGRPGDRIGLRDAGRDDEEGNVDNEVGTRGIQLVCGRHFRSNELTRYNGDASGPGDASGLVHRYIQFPTFFWGDAGAYLAEMVTTRVLFLLEGGGTGKVLNRNYIGFVRDPAGLSQHCFGISAIVDFTDKLQAKTMAICNGQSDAVLRQFRQNLPFDFELVLPVPGKENKYAKLSKRWDERYVSVCVRLMLS